MSIFDDEVPMSEDPPAGARPSLGKRSFRERFGWWAITVAIVIGILFALLPSPYVIEQPGPVFDTLGTRPRATKRCRSSRSPTRRPSPPSTASSTS